MTNLPAAQQQLHSQFLYLEAPFYGQKPNMLFSIYKLD